VNCIFSEPLKKWIWNSTVKVLAQGFTWFVYWMQPSVWKRHNVPVHYRINDSIILFCIEVMFRRYDSKFRTYLKMLEDHVRVGWVDVCILYVGSSEMAKNVSGMKYEGVIDSIAVCSIIAWGRILASDHVYAISLLSQLTMTASSSISSHTFIFEFNFDVSHRMRIMTKL